MSSAALIPFFFTFALLMAGAAVILAVPIVATFMETGLVPRFPTAILATGMVLVSVLSVACGLILDSINRGRMEMKRLHFLNIARFEGRRPADPPVADPAFDDPADPQGS